MYNEQTILPPWLFHLFRALHAVVSRAELEKTLKEALSTLSLFEEVILILPDATNGLVPLLLKPAIINKVRQKQALADTSTLLQKDGFLERVAHLPEATLFQYRVDRQNRKLIAAPIRSGPIAPVPSGSATSGFLLFYCRPGFTATQHELDLADGIALPVSAALSSINMADTYARQTAEINALRKQLSIGSTTIPNELSESTSTQEIVGSGAAMRKIAGMITHVSQTPTTVLILGETGTGKELIARALHNRSARSSREMVKVNCASLPPSLIESELFGHEKGSFTGATDRRIGKFEQANNSTLFLDEIGELASELQVKLLRVLQEGEIDRIGGKTTIKVNVRLIAATNRDLMKEVNAGRFRSDLYFRLNVFPIRIPALRERKEDIPALAKHFLRKYTSKLKIPVARITSKTMKQLVAYNWPGNVRELEHMIERGVLLAKDKDVTYLPVPGLIEDEMGINLRNSAVKTLQEVERDHILEILKMTNGKISGVGGAAEMLKIPATTLASKMIKLKIRREAF